MAKFVINLKDVMDVSTRDYISNNVEMFKSTTPGPKGDDGLRGPQGVGVHHMKGTSTTDHEGDFSTAGEYDTYTFYADANEEFPLAWFTVKNGEDPWRRAVDRGYRGTEEEFYTVLGMVEEYAMISLEAIEVTTENREQVALDAAQVAEDRIAVEEAKDLAIEKADVHIARVDNPHGVTKAQVGLSNVQNIDTTNPININQDSTHRFVTDAEKINWNGKINATEKAVANGVATLDVNGKVVLTQIPDSVLGQLQYMGIHNFSSSLPTATEKGQYWIASSDGNGYITGDWAVWNGTSFNKVDNTDAVATVAGRTGNVVLTKSDVGLSNVDNTSDANKPVSTATQNALNLKANIASPTFTGTVTAPTFSGSLSGNASSATNVAWSGVTSKPTTISGYGITDAQPLDPDLTAIAGLAGTSGILKKTAVNTWVLDTNTYGTSSGVTSVTGTAPIVSSGGNTPSISISAATTSEPGSMSAADKTKLDGIASGANNYTHPTGDGNLHVPATGTTNNGKVLTAGATAGSLSWTTIPSAQVSSVNGMTGDVTVTTITGNSATATKLETARTINGVAFDGSANITVSDATKQNTLVSGTNIKTINSSSILSSGNLALLTSTNPSIIGSITEQVYNLTGTEINPSNGTIQYKTVNANTTFTETLTAGQSVLLRLIDASSYTITFPTITWVGAVAPILTANCAIVLWKEQSILYGAYVGTLV